MDQSGMDGMDAMMERYPLSSYAEVLPQFAQSNLSHLSIPGNEHSGARAGAKGKTATHRGLSGVDGQRRKESRVLKFFSVRKDKRMDRTAMQRRKLDSGDDSRSSKADPSEKGAECEQEGSRETEREQARAFVGGVNSGSGSSSSFFSSRASDLETRLKLAGDRRAGAIVHRNEIGAPRLMEYCARVESNEPALQLTGMRFLRERLTVPVSPPIREVMETGIVPRLIAFLRGQHIGGRVVNKPGQGYVSPSYAYASLHDTVFIEMSPHDSTVNFNTYLDAGVVDPTCMLSECMQATEADFTGYAAWRAGEGAAQPNTTVNTYLAHRKLYHLLQYEAAWCLSQIATNEEDEAGKVLIDNGSIPLVIALIAYTTYEKVREACLLFIGNLTAFVDECRDIFLDSNATVALLWQLGLCKCPPHRQTTSPSLSTMENVGWALDNLAKGEPPPLRKYTLMTIEALSYLIHCPVETTTLAGLNTVLTLVDNSCAAENVELILESGLMNRVYELLKISEDLMPIWTIVQKYQLLGCHNNSHVQLTVLERTTLQQRMLSIKTNTKMRVLALRVFCAAFRSPIMMHKRILLNRQKFPFVWELMLWELGGDACLQTLVLGDALVPAMSARAGWQPNNAWGYQSTKLHVKMQAASESQTQKADILGTFCSLIDACDADDALYSQLGARVPAAVYVDSDTAYLSRLVSGQFLDVALHQIDLHNSYMLDTHIAQTLFVMLRRALQLPIYRDDRGCDTALAAAHIPPSLLTVLQQHSFCAKSFFILMRILDHAGSSSGTSGNFGVYDSEFVFLILCAVESFIRWSMFCTFSGSSEFDTGWSSSFPAPGTGANYFRSEGSSILQQVLGDTESRRILSQAVGIVQMAQRMPQDVVDVADRIDKVMEEVAQMLALHDA